MSNLKQFKFESIGEIDNGSLQTEIDNCIHQAYLDCADRPGVGTARKVTLEISLIPEIQGTGLGRIHVGFNVKKSFPSKGLGVVMKPGDVGMEFQPEILDNPDQRALNFDDDK